MPTDMYKINRYLADIQLAVDAISQCLIGKTVRVTKHWNGQVYGNSRKDRRGEYHKVLAVHVSDGRISLKIIEYLCYIDLREVEVID